METISWNCTHDSEEQKQIHSKIDELKCKINDYEILLNNNQITQYMYEAGIFEIKLEITKIIQADDSDLLGEDKTVGTVGGFCPECNKLEHDLDIMSRYSSFNTDNKILYDLEHAGTRLVLKNGKYGKFWGCSRYPQCKYSISTYENTCKKTDFTKYKVTYPNEYDWDDINYF